MWSRVALAAGHPLCHFVMRSVHFGHLGRPCTPLHPLTQSAVASSPPSLCLNREREREIGIFWDLLSVASPALSSHGGTRLDPFQGHTGPSIKPREPEIHDGGVARNLLCARCSCIPSAGGGIHGGFCCNILPGIWCAIVPSPPLTVVVIRPGGAQSNPIEDPTHIGLYNSMRGIYRYWPPF
jgi:hypothetical protein